MRGSFIIIFFFVITASTVAQESRRLVWEGGVAIDYELIKGFRFNSSLMQRTAFLENNEGNFTELSFLEINHFITRKLNPIMNVSLGYKYRNNEPVDQLDVFEHRFTEQLAYTHLDRRLRLVSRVRLEQRIRSTNYANRYRYRLSFDAPLRGEKIDPGEFFIVGSSELLYEDLKGGSNTWENRLSGSLGYVISENIKADFTLTLRLEDINIKTEEVLFLNTGIIIRLN